MRKSLCIMALLFATSFAQPAFADETYTINFGALSGPNGTGSFTYNDGVFSNFDVNWDGATISFTSAANAVSPLVTINGCSSPGLFAYLTENGCGNAFNTWGGAHNPAGLEGDFNFLSGTDGSVVISVYCDFCYSIWTPSNGGGSFTVGPALATPEPASVYLMLLGIALMLVMQKRNVQGRRTLNTWQ